MTKDQLVTKLDQITTTRQEWEQTEYQASNKILYKVLGNCFKVLEQVSGEDSLIEHITAQLKLKGIPCNSNSSLETRIVRWVFGDCGKRVYLYVNVLKAARDKPKSKSMTAWIVSENGLENISRSKNGKSPANIRNERIEAASAYFKIADPICAIESDDEQFAVMLDASSPFSLALLRSDSSGKPEVVYGSNNQTVINAILVSVGRNLEQSKVDQSGATQTVGKSEVSLPTLTTSVLSEVISDQAEGEEISEVQGDTTPADDVSDQSVEEGNRREVKLSIDLPAEVRERIVGYAA